MKTSSEHVTAKPTLYHGGLVVHPQKESRGGLAQSGWSLQMAGELDTAGPIL